MNAPQLRRIRSEDAPQLAALWSRVFEDPEELPLTFLRLLPELGGGMTLEQDGTLLGAAYVVTDFCLEDRRAAYLYAVAVLPEARGRGYGMILSRRAAALGRELGAELLCTLPAEPGLYPWYEQGLGLRCALYRREERIRSRPGPSLRSLSPEEYGRRRELLLANRPHIRPGAGVLRYEKANCLLSGGDLLAVGDGLAAVFRERETARIRELLCPETEDRKLLAASVGAALKTEQVLLLSPAAEGRPYLAADRPLPPDLVWNLTME